MSRADLLADRVVAGDFDQCRLLAVGVNVRTDDAFSFEAHQNATGTIFFAQRPQSRS